MQSTPPLPLWIREAIVPGYTNIHQLCPHETRLFGTESLYGDWGARVLLLAKDFAPSSFVRDRIGESHARPYSHAPEFRTNHRLMDLAKPIEPLGVLYGSALGNLLRDDGARSGTLPNRADALQHGTKILEFIISHMPALQWIVCLGQDAWECACVAERQEGEWQAHRDHCEPLGRLIAAYHPAARISIERQRGPWSLLKKLTADRFGETSA